VQISFNRHLSEAILHSPLKNFELDHQPIEHRVDPLTGHTAIVRTGRKFWQRQYTTDEKLLSEIATKTRESCFFCPEKVNQYTPRYPEEFIKGGRIAVGEACLFPNLFAQKEDSAIVVIAHQHFIHLDQFSPQLLSNAFKACSIYLKRLYEYKATKYCEIGFNYMFPGGSSLPHPHLQVLGSSLPTFFLSNLLENSQKYYAETGSCFWKDLINSEKEIGERYIGRLGNIEWLVPFAPTREDEAHGIVRGKSNFLQFDDSDWENIADGISKVFNSYADDGLSSCNFALYSGPLGEKLDYLWTGIKIVSRSSVQAQPVNDVWFSQNLLYDGLVTKPPEEVAKSLRSYF